MIPVIDLTKGTNDINECENAAKGLEIYGAIVVKTDKYYNNDEFMDLVEDYFNQPIEELRKDERPQHSYQVGATIGQEKAKCFATTINECTDIIENLEPSERPKRTDDNDLKYRFFHRMQTIPPNSTFNNDKLENIAPSKFVERNWNNIMDKAGNEFIKNIELVAKMVAIGLSLPENTFVDAARYGPHLLAPTGSDLSKYGYKDSVLAAFHTDLNFLTIHGKSRYSGLSIWARNSGKKINVSVPDGCYLVQAGKQIEHFTGGKILAGFHEVTVNDKTLEQIEHMRRNKPDRPLMRVSSTFFYHLSSDYQLPQHERYPSMKVGELVMNELKSIGLSEEAQ